MVIERLAGQYQSALQDYLDDSGKISITHPFVCDKLDCVFA
jgi:hypothetical protein